MMLLLLLLLVLFPANVITEIPPNPKDSLLKNRRWKRSLDSFHRAMSAAAVPLQSSNSDFICSVDQVLSDPCLFKYDGVCDAGSADCVDGSDCFDCDPCYQNYLTCGSCVADPSCVWCETIDPIFQTYVGLCNSVEFSQAVPFACGTDASESYSNVCPDKQTNNTGTCDILSDVCLYQFDLVCDSAGNSTVCAAGTDCFDCDPCQNIVTEAIASSILDVTELCNLCVTAGCIYCTGTFIDGSLAAVCTSPYFASLVPNICVNSGGSPFQDSCGVETPPPVPINISFSDSCDYSNDSCVYARDGTCDSGDSFFDFCDPNSDCIDCDPCQQKRYDGCEACVGAGCFWCPLDALCLSGNPLLTRGFGNSSNPFPKQISCSAEEFTQVCVIFNSENLFDDPLYDAERWVYDLIGVQQVWESGITGAGVGIRINDDGVDATHPEFSSKFIVESSCSLYLPAVMDAKHSHGTTCASLAAGDGNNSLCSVGIAPRASISGCRVIPTGKDDDLASVQSDSSYLYANMENMHVSLNSYSIPSCTRIARSPSLVTRINRRLQQCPFSATNITGVSPCAATVCSTVDWSSPSPSSECEAFISLHCQRFFESDVAACTSFLDLFVTCVFNSLTVEEQLAISKGATEGRNGKGIVYVVAAGDDYENGADVNFAGWQSSRYAIVVGAVDKGGQHSSFSNSGAALFICAPGGDLEYYFNNAVAVAGGTCTNGGAETSFAAAVVSGVVALMLEANPDLSWRDVQGVLAKSATLIRPSDPSWTTNSAGLRHSNLFGFGLVNASAAVKLSKEWNLLSPEVQIQVESGQVNISIPDFPSDAVVSTIIANANDTFKIESVVTYLDLYHSSRGELRIAIKSPSGTESVLSPGQRPENSQLSERWKLTSVSFRDEPAAGSWTLSIVDQTAGDVSSCVDSLDWSLNVTSTTSEVLVVNCRYFQLNALCVNGTAGPKFFENFPGSVGVSDSGLANKDGLTPADACCACGGGLNASALQNQLLSWRLVVYGNDPELVPSPTSAVTPITSPTQVVPSTADTPTPLPNTAPLPSTVSAPLPTSSADTVSSNTSPVPSIDGSPNIGAIVGGLVGGLLFTVIIAGLFFQWGKRTTKNYQTPQITSRADVLDSQVNTDENTLQATASIPSTIQTEPVAAALDNVSVLPYATRMNYPAAPAISPDPYNVQFKDQARSVVGLAQAATVVATAVPMAEAIPFAIAMDANSELPGQKLEEI